MRASVALFLVALIFAQSAQAGLVAPHTIRSANGVKKVGADLCPFCVSTMGQIMSQLVQIILNGGVLGSCGALCSQLPNQLESTACNLLCDYVGIETFVKVLQYEDPDPIYVCQLIDICPHVNGGKANMTSCNVVPKQGAQGATFNIQIVWQVLKPTGPGGINLVILANGAQPMSAGAFIEGQAVGQYDAQFQLQAQPNEQEPFNPGQYQVQIALCEGDCTTSHPWGGV